MSADTELHRPLINVAGARGALNTPVLVIDRDALDRNIARMAAFARAHAIALRPHAKTHKSADIARLQCQAGAVGVCCAKLGEAEALGEQGVESILITSPVVTPQAIARLVQLHGRIKDLRVTADSPANVAMLSQAFSASPRPLPVLVDVDPGIRRTGVASPEAARALARQIGELPALSFAGVQMYCGMQQHIEDFAARRTAIEERTAYLRGVLDMLRADGIDVPVVTGGGTGTHTIDAALGVYTELQVGSYVFMDRQYHACDLDGAGTSPYETSLFVDASVVSANTPGMATVDAGFKAFSTDGPTPTVIGGAPADAQFFFMGDEHGAIVAPGQTFAIGDRIVLGAPHCDPTVNLYDAFHVVRDGTLIDIWPVTARGRSR